MGIHNRYPRVYRELKRLGFSASKAIEIIFDAMRGNSYALNWVRVAMRTARIERKG